MQEHLWFENTTNGNTGDHSPRKESKNSSTFLAQLNIFPLFKATFTPGICRAFSPLCSYWTSSKGFLPLWNSHSVNCRNGKFRDLGMKQIWFDSLLASLNQIHVTTGAELQGTRGGTPPRKMFCPPPPSPNLPPIFESISIVINKD